jgi:nucleolin
MARRAGKHGDIKIVEKAIKREQGKSLKANKANKKQAKAAAKKAESSDSDSSDGSMHNIESRIPCKKRIAKRNVRYNSNGEIVDIEDSDSEDDRKMPAQISRKKPKKKVAEDPMDTDSSDEEQDCKASKEEKAFLKSIGKKEITINDSDSDSD